MFRRFARWLYHNLPFMGVLNGCLTRGRVLSRLQARAAYPQALGVVQYASRVSGEVLAARVLQEYKALRELNVAQYGIDAYLDVGANVGQNTLAARAYFPGEVPIYAIEPSTDCHPALRQISTQFPHVTFFGVGLGDETRQLTFNRSTSSRTSQASTFLEFSEAYRAEAAWARSPVIREVVEVYTLADWAQRFAIAPGRNWMLHIDAEGFDYQVLKGAEGLFPQIAVIIVEVTFGLFNGQKTFEDICALLRPTFVFQGGLGGVALNRHGRPMYQDMIFVRRDLVR